MFQDVRVQFVMTVLDRSCPCRYDYYTLLLLLATNGLTVKALTYQQQLFVQATTLTLHTDTGSCDDDVTCKQVTFPNNKAVDSSFRTEVECLYMQNYGMLEQELLGVF
jgi:hypothetical protein